MLNGRPSSIIEPIVRLHSGVHVVKEWSLQAEWQYHMIKFLFRLDILTVTAFAMNCAEWNRIPWH